METKTESLSIIDFDCGSKWNHSAMTKCNTGTLSRLMTKPKSTAQRGRRWDEFGKGERRSSIERFHEKGEKFLDETETWGVVE